MTPTGSGSSAWTQQLDILPVFHASSPDADHFNKTAIADHSSGDHLVTIEPDYAGLTSAIKFGDFTSPAAQVGYAYDRYLRPITIQTGDSPKSLDLTLTRDFSGNITGKNEPAWDSVPAINDSYAYDGMNRLVNGEGDENTFDELSNLVGKGSAKYRYEDPDDPGKDQMRLEAFNDGTEQNYTYDADGNITGITNRFTSLSYDNLGRLRQIVGTRTDDYWYDHTGLRIKRTEDSTGTPLTTYTMYEGNNPLMQEVYEGSTRKAVWFQILVGEQILARVGKTYPSTATTLYFALDNLGSRRVVFDAAGALVDRYRYSAWGVATQDAGTDSLASFTGKDYDATGLLYFNARYYDALTGRFLSEDPARKGSGWYSYCDGNPVNATDPTGLDLSAAQTREAQLNGGSFRGSSTVPGAGGGEIYRDIYQARASISWTPATPGLAMGPNVTPMNAPNKGPARSPSPMETWMKKPSGGALTKEEAIVQTVVGSGLMVAGAVGGVAGAEITGGTSVLAGVFVMADGGYMVGQANSGVKANPGEMLLTLTTPTPVQVGDQQYQFMSPLP